MSPWLVAFCLMAGGDSFFGGDDRIGRIYEQQFAGLGKKLAAIALIAVGVALIA